jgi:uncharacterized protein YbjT (DUF2867 family)
MTAAAILAAAVIAPRPDRRSRHRVFDLVGPVALSYRDFVSRLARLAEEQGRPPRFETRSIPVEEADRLAASGGYRGMPPEELDCLLCDEVSDPGPLVALLDRPLTDLDDALAAAVQGTAPVV